MTRVAKISRNTTCVAMIEGDAWPFNPTDLMTREAVDFLKRSAGRCVAGPFKNHEHFLNSLTISGFLEQF